MYRTRLTLKPGAPGTLQLVNEYGPRLVCVRYRYDEQHHVRVKTVELIVEQRPWTPSRPEPDPMEYVHLRLSADRLTARAIKRLGGLWNPETGTWRITYAAATLLRLADHIVAPSTNAVDGGGT